MTVTSEVAVALADGAVALEIDQPGRLVLVESHPRSDREAADR